jgi:hypothetical protein
MSGPLRNPPDLSHTCRRQRVPFRRIGLGNDHNEAMVLEPMTTETVAFGYEADKRYGQ